MGNEPQKVVSGRLTKPKKRFRICTEGKNQKRVSQVSETSFWCRMEPIFLQRERVNKGKTTSGCINKRHVSICFYRSPLPISHTPRYAQKTHDLMLNVCRRKLLTTKSTKSRICIKEHILEIPLRIFRSSTSQLFSSLLFIFYHVYGEISIVRHRHSSSATSLFKQTNTIEIRSP